MGYVIKQATGGGGGGGDATAANQVLQINQLENLGQPLLKENSGDSVFTYGANNDSVLKYNIANYLGSTTTKCVGFTAANVNALASTIESFFTTGNFYINSICYADSGGTHSALVTYTQI